MGLGPVPATEKALERAGLDLDEIGSVELNEAFATQSLACIRRLGLDPERVNADGGAIALGHPLGSSGSRLIVTLLGRMEREDSRYGSRRCAWASDRARRSSWSASDGGGHEPLGVDGPLRVERFDDRVVATLNRPDKRNAIDQATIDALHVLCAELEAIPRILILTGAGGVFASGADIAELRERRRMTRAAASTPTRFVRVADLPMPVIAALDGYALGGGAELAYAADIRIATPRLRIGNPETGLGIIAAAARAGA
jgi:hypothetical protein